MSAVSLLSGEKYWHALQRRDFEPLSWLGLPTKLAWFEATLSHWQLAAQVDDKVLLLLSQCPLPDLGNVSSQGLLGNDAG